MDQILDYINEMAKKASVCGNCGQTMTGNHYYRNQQTFCKKAALERAKTQGLNPTNNVSRPSTEEEVTLDKSQFQASETLKKMRTSTASAAPNQTNGVIDSVVGPITQDQLEEWLDDVGYDLGTMEYKIFNGKLNTQGNFHLDDEDITHIPVPFGDVGGSFQANIETLKSFENFPMRILGNLYAYDTGVESFDGLRTEVDGTVDITMNQKLADWVGVYKHLRRIGGTLKFDVDYVKRGGLGVLLIKELQEISSGNSDVDTIINKYLKGDRSVLDCQEELIDAGFAHLART